MEIDEYLEEEQESKLKKILVIIGGIILIILIISYLIVSFPIFQILESLSESNIAEDQKIDIDDFSIIFTKETYNKLQELYHKNLEVEFVACLQGIKETDYNINQIYTPEIIDQSFNHVSFKPCSQDTLIVLHSHPYRHCIGSEQDIRHLNELKERNENSLIIIMSEENRFTVYN